MKKLLLIFCFTIFAKLSYSQFVEGIVTDNAGEPMIGVNIVNLTTDENTISNIDGKFKIAAKKSDKLSFTYIGYETLEKTVDSDYMKAVMSDKATALEEIVVVGYGTKKAGSITGSVTQVKSDDIVKTPAQSAIQAIQGKAAGVNIVTNDEPGAQPTILIRGLGTVLSGYEPLYVIDGVEANSMNGLSANDIETIDILKDASSLAIYGQKGSNGVVLITTKKGKKGEIKLSFDSYYGVKTVQKKVKMADSRRFAFYNNVARGSDLFLQEGQPYNTDWFDEITSLGSVFNNSFNITGGSEYVDFNFGVSKYIENGILNGTKYDRTNIISKNNYKLFNNKLKISQFINISSSTNTPKPLSAFTSAYKQSPIIPVKNELGRYAIPIVTSDGVFGLTGVEKFNNVSNPVADLYYADDHEKTFELFGSLGAEVNILKCLKFNTSFGADFEWDKGYSYRALEEIWLYQNPSETAEDYTSPEKVNSLSQYRTDIYNWNWDNFFTFHKTYGIHDVTAVVGMSRSTTNNWEYLGGTRYNVPLQDNYWYLDFSTNNDLIDPGSTISNSHGTPVVNLAYFGRLEYEYSDKYLLSTSIRREGISTFQEDNRFAVFPAVSLGWVLSNEDFFDKIKSFDYLKLRGGYGIVGNGRGTPSVNTVLFQSGENYPFGYDQVINAGSAIPYQIDPNLIGRNERNRFWYRL
ncbi:MAG: SusC/RagA family TonB-linked outer membrane protein [Saprospiraceae bacterium]